MRGFVVNSGVKCFITIARSQDTRMAIFYFSISTVKLNTCAHGVDMVKKFL